MAGSPEAEGSSAAALFDLMRKAGYESWIFSDGRLRRRVPGDKWLNYFFLKEDHPYLLPHLFLPRQTVIRPGGGDLRDSKLLRVMGRISQYSNPVPLASPALTLRPSIDAKIVRRGDALNLRRRADPLSGVGAPRCRQEIGESDITTT